MRGQSQSVSNTVKMPFIILDWSLTDRLLLQPTEACDAASLCLLKPNNTKLGKPLSLDRRSDRSKIPEESEVKDDHQNFMNAVRLMGDTQLQESFNSYRILTNNVVNWKNARVAYFAINLMHLTARF